VTNSFDGIVERMRRLRIVPVIVIDDPDDAVPLARALADGGLPCAEVTFRTPRAAEALRRIAAECPELLAGAGTVLTPDQVTRAREAGASFIVAPGFSPAVVDHCLEHGIPIFPGVCTPTEIEAALARGLDVLKLFPAEPMGGVGFLRAVSAPYGGVRFIPTGGISAANVGAYLAMKQVVACGGSWMAPSEWIAAKRFDRIREATREAATAAGVAGAPAGASAP
jgi:2-dehydro-3-deoxyphosphogluconate aldolase/(4S)-4-hydroxy-2-oxoglutarate aldolase